MKVLSIFLILFSSTATYASNPYIGDNGDIIEFKKSTSSQCTITLKNNSIKNTSTLTLGGEGSNYFFEACNGLVSLNVNPLNNSELIYEIRMSTAVNHYSAIRIINVNNHKLFDNEKLSYELTTCFNLKQEKDNEKYINILINNKSKLSERCDIDTGLVKILKKSYLYNTFDNRSISYLVPNDEVYIENYEFNKDNIWFFVNYKNKIKKWLSCDAFDLCIATK